MYRPILTLTVNTAKSALEAGLEAVHEGQNEFDLAQLTLVDSSAVAALLAWSRAAAATGRSLTFHNAPANLLSLTQLYGVDALLHLPPLSAARHPISTLA